MGIGFMNNTTVIEKNCPTVIEKNNPTVIILGQP
jgi:hypothetical protein